MKRTTPNVTSRRTVVDLDAVRSSRRAQPLDLRLERLAAEAGAISMPRITTLSGATITLETERVEMAISIIKNAEAMLRSPIGTTVAGPVADTLHRAQELLALADRAVS